MSLVQRDTDGARSDLGLDWDLQRLDWFRRDLRNPLRSRREKMQPLREIGEAGLRRLFEADEIGREEFEDLFGALLRAVS